MDTDGLVGPFPLLDSSSAHELGDRLQGGPEPLTWLKGAAATSPEIFRLASEPALLDRVEEMIGPNILLCGANVVERDPGQQHPWHVDVHYAGPGPGASLWIGLDGVDAASTLHVVPGSHRFGCSPQQMVAESDSDAGVDAHLVQELASSIDPDAAIVPVLMGDGDAVLFDAALWHGTLNESGHLRTALVVHYAAPQTPIRIHGNGLHWPTEYVEDPLPPCHLVRGSDIGSVNRVIPGPSGVTALNSIHAPGPDLGSAPVDWKPDPLHRGPTSTLAHLLVKRHRVGTAQEEHAPHSHPYDQIVISHGGVGQLDIGGGASTLGASLGAASIAFLPAGTVHAAHSTSSSDHIHIDVSFIGSARSSSGSPEPLGATVIDLDSIHRDELDFDERGRSSVTLLEGETNTATRVAVKRVDLAPRFCGEPDVDVYDVVMVVHAGKLETLDAVVGPGAVVLYGAGEVHQLKAAGTDPVTLVVAELHATSVSESRVRTDRRVPSMGVSRLRRNIVRRLPRGFRLTVRRGRRKIKDLSSR